MRVQQAKSLELRAEMSLARFWRDQGKVQARELFAQYEWFTEDFNTRDQKETKALTRVGLVNLSEWGRIISAVVFSGRS